MLINCPECGKQISDKAISCPNCGYPMKSSPKPVARHKKRRLPNGFGQISLIRGRNLQKPYRAMVTVGKDENGRPICKPLRPNAYFKTYNDAYSALLEFNKNPYDLSENITMNELFERWSESHFKRVTKRTADYWIGLWKNHCGKIFEMKVTDVRTRDIKECMYGNGTNSAPTVINIRSMLSMMLSLAVSYEIVPRNCAKDVVIDQTAVGNIKVVQPHTVFTDEELAVLWQHSDDDNAAVALIQCYSGWRPSELIKLSLDTVDLDAGIMTGGSKTDAGRDRVVPIHPAIKPLLERFARKNKKGLIFPFTAESYRNKLKRLADAYQISVHIPHDGRKTFVTLAKRFGVDEYAIKRIVGHKISDLTESVYTERDVEWLREELQKIRV